MVAEKPRTQNDLTKEQVADYLRSHPAFLKEHPELLEIMLPPAAQHGDGVLDMQQFMVGKLQKNVQSLKGRFDGLVTAARDNLSVQHQVHNAVLGLIKARELGQLLEIITVDLVSLFDVDVIRVAMESEAAALYDTYYSEQNYSGIVFIDTGVVDAAMADDRTIRLVEDSDKAHIAGFDQIFADCAALIKSCALLRLHLPITQREVILAFGVRHADRFHSGQGVDMLTFLAQITEHCLDKCLNESDIIPPE